MKYILKDKYSKMLEIYPNFNSILNRKIKDLGKEQVVGDYVYVNNILTGYYDKIYVSDFLLNEDKDEYYISPKSPLSFILNKDVLEGAEYDKLQQYIQDQLEDSTRFVFCCINIDGQDQSLNIPKDHIIKVD